jgi:hypothetical protein
MANVARPNGLSPVKYASGAPYNGAYNTYAIPVTDTTASYAIGDIVLSAGGSDANGVPFVRKVPAASASDFAALGVIVGISPVDAGVSLEGANLDLTQLYIPAGTRTAVRYIQVADDPNLIFEASAGSVATNFTLANARRNTGIASNVASVDAAYAINQTTLASKAPQSNVVLSSATVATTNTLPIQMLGLVQRIDNEVGAFSRILCRFNRHELAVAGASNFTGL